MLNIIPLLLLVFGWIYQVKGLVIASLCISSFYILCVMTSAILGISRNEDFKFESGTFLVLTIFTLSIIRLVI